MLKKVLKKSLKEVKGGKFHSVSFPCFGVEDAGYPVDDVIREIQTTLQAFEGIMVSREAAIQTFCIPLHFCCNFMACRQRKELCMHLWTIL